MVTQWAFSLAVFFSLLVCSFGNVAHGLPCVGTLAIFSLQVGVAFPRRLASAKPLGPSRFATPLTPHVREQLERNLSDNYQGLSAMRGENGLVTDTVHVKQDGKGGYAVEPYKTGTAPTDTGLDLAGTNGNG